jgi:hypothetical protein
VGTTCGILLRFSCPKIPKRRHIVCQKRAAKHKKYHLTTKNYIFSPVSLHLFVLVDNFATQSRMGGKLRIPLIGIAQNSVS